MGGQLYQGVETGGWSCFAAGGLDICILKTCCYFYEFHLIIYKKRKFKYGYLLMSYTADSKQVKKWSVGQQNTCHQLQDS